MAKSDRLPFFLRAANALVSLLLRAGVPMGSTVMLTVAGRKSGRPRATPVTILERDGKRYLIAAYGIVDWVRNLRAAGSGTITRGRRSNVVSAIELSPAEAAPILEEAITTGPSFLRSSFDATPTSPVEDFEKEAPRHPVFQLVEASDQGARDRSSPSLGRR